MLKFILGVIFGALFTFVFFLVIGAARVLRDNKEYEEKDAHNE